MDDRGSEYLEQFREALKSWNDERFVSRQEVEDLAMFNSYIVNLAETDGWTYDGHSFAVGVPMSRLVVRGTIDGIPHVVFSSGRKYTGCVRAFLRKMTEGWLEWQVDRFRQ